MAAAHRIALPSTKGVIRGNLKSLLQTEAYNVGCAVSLSVE
jgi:hypothetical protein